MPRITEEEKEAGNFDVFEGWDYNTQNFDYSNDAFDRISALVEFNAKVNEDVIKDAIVQCVRRGKEARNVPVQH